MSASLGRAKIKAVLIDITGVLYESGTKQAITGSVEAIEKLRSSGITFKFVTNETQNTTRGLALKLNGFGFSGLNEREIFAPAPSVREYLIRHGLRPHFLIHPGVEPEFDGIDTSNPNCVVLGDAAENFSYDNVNKAFNVLLGLDDRKLISMGKGRFFQEQGQLVIDLGAYAAALEYACDTTATVIGKPGEQFFRSALEAVGSASPLETVMIGDDINGDVGGSQSLGMRGILVRTGKFRAGRDDVHPRVRPDAIVDNLDSAVDLIMKTNEL